MTSFPFHDQFTRRPLASAWKLRSKRRSGFTLIETALALGIVAFALVPVVALLPIGLQTSKSASDLTMSAQIAQRLAGMIQQTDEPSSKLANGSSTLMGSYYYFDGEGQPLATTSGTVNGVPTAAVYTASIQHLSASSATLVDSAVATTLYVQIVNDPGHRLQGTTPNSTLPADLQSHAVVIPVYFANNGT